jgi:hypothetical protein
MRTRTITSRWMTLRVIVGLALVFGLAIPAGAQSVSAGAGGLWINDNKAMHLNFGGDYPLKSTDTLEIQGVGEFGVSFFDSTTKWLGGGARVIGKKNSKFMPFGQVVVGAFFCCDDTALGLQFGGGVDVPVNPIILRFQGDIPMVFNEGDSRTGFRLTAGIVFQFKK